MNVRVPVYNESGKLVTIRETYIEIMMLKEYKNLLEQLLAEQYDSETEKEAN